MPESISADSVSEQVSRILCSEGFARAERLRRFLKFTVDHALDGRSAELKEYLVGTERAAPKCLGLLNQNSRW